jgi:hypothetical protein
VMGPGPAGRLSRVLVGWHPRRAPRANRTHSSSWPQPGPCSWAAG